MSEKNEPDYFWVLVCVAVGIFLIFDTGEPSLREALTHFLMNQGKCNG